nr:MAG TPA: hypothetical protein [Caudoviricetes sp.]
MNLIGQLFRLIKLVVGVRLIELFFKMLGL